MDTPAIGKQMDDMSSLGEGNTVIHAENDNEPKSISALNELLEQQLKEDHAVVSGSFIPVHCLIDNTGRLNNSKTRVIQEEEASVVPDTMQSITEEGVGSENSSFLCQRDLEVPNKEKEITIKLLGAEETPASGAFESSEGVGAEEGFVVVDPGQEKEEATNNSLSALVTELGITVEDPDHVEDSQSCEEGNPSMASLLEARGVEANEDTGADNTTKTCALNSEPDKETSLVSVMESYLNEQTGEVEQNDGEENVVESGHAKVSEVGRDMVEEALHTAMLSCVSEEDQEIMETQIVQDEEPMETNHQSCNENEEFTEGLRAGSNDMETEKITDAKNDDQQLRDSREIAQEEIAMETNQISDSVENKEPTHCRSEIDEDLFADTDMEVSESESRRDGTVTGQIQTVADETVCSKSENGDETAKSETRSDESGTTQKESEEAVESRREGDKTVAGKTEDVSYHQRENDRAADSQNAESLSENVKVSQSKQAKENEAAAESKSKGRKRVEGQGEEEEEEEEKDTTVESTKHIPSDDISPQDKKKESSSNSNAGPVSTSCPVTTEKFVLKPIKSTSNGEVAKSIKKLSKSIVIKTKSVEVKNGNGITGERVTAAAANDDGDDSVKGKPSTVAPTTPKPRRILKRNTFLKTATDSRVLSNSTDSHGTTVTSAGEADDKETPDSEERVEEEEILKSNESKDEEEAAAKKKEEDKNAEDDAADFFDSSPLALLTKKVYTGPRSKELQLKEKENTAAPPTTDSKDQPRNNQNKDKTGKPSFRKAALEQKVGENGIEKRPTIDIEAVKRRFEEVSQSSRLDEESAMREVKQMKKETENILKQINEEMEKLRSIFGVRK